MPRRVRHPGLRDAGGSALPHHLMEVAGVWTYVVDAGQGPPILLLHGYGDTADAWRRVVPRLLRRHRVIALDLPPFGRSDRPHERDLFDFYHRTFVPELLDELEVGPATVIGHSLGGAIALRLAMEHPPRVARLGLVAPAGLGTSPPWWWYLLTGRPLWHGALSVPNPLATPVIRECMRRFVAWRVVDDARELQPELRHFVDMHGSARDLRALLRAGRACMDSYTGRLLDDSRVLRCPKWLVWGERDGLVPVAHARAFAETHPDAEVHLLPCGHYPQIECPGRFNALLGVWLDQTRAAEPALRRVEAA